MELRYSDRVSGIALFSLKKIPMDALVFILKGEIQNQPTKYTIEIGEAEHIVDSRVCI